ncbi:MULTISPECIES: dipeptidase [Methylorubrum]|uniref:dipeptidase n=1 Tax=Methylorubrum TaxID=2282523 RepID=UPI00209F507D|nr:MULTISPECIES: dipeptidase [Methylorubrum]MCP1546794.1 acetylornithine deacetylase/succinyl-diaminopimelate desuccinylase-like protein [Methylorubrum zatmanii]MCP1551927.1 acetylornithine deacetylase/succinyl-diaminopimelate desuccinylase-like protein [Methylorubrum extorquens]MCP1577097.1 acetylornithine deacetylase/succinyl-diaminopimelate desuccinylase-like protein [Methylorubrum extorquens]
MADALAPVLNDIDRDLDNSLERLFAWLRIPSISTDSAYAGHCREAAQWLEGNLTALGFETSVEETSLHPVVLAHRPKPGAPHVLFYGHYDVQPVDPLNLWRTSPFEPRIEEADGTKRIVARGASDDKGQVMTFVEACRAHLAMNGDLPVGVTILIEGAEENGSQGLPEWVEANRERLKADVVLVCDTGMWDRETPQITTSLRGLAYYEVKVTCADRDLHSGFFGGAAANPIHVLSRILADLHDSEGRVTLPGFYDGVREPPPELLEQWRGLGLTPEKFLGPIGLREPAGERGRLPIELIQSRPACDVNGIIGGYTGEGTKTVIASQASAKVSFRLVDDQDPEQLSKTFEAFVRERIPTDCSVEVICYKGSRAVALPYDMPQLAAAQAALSAEWGRAAVAVGAGGSIPIVGDFKRLLGLDTLLIGFGLDDDRIHSPNEKYELTSFHKGTRSWARILSALAQA